MYVQVFCYAVFSFDIQRHSHIELLEVPDWRSVGLQILPCPTEYCISWRILLTRLSPMSCFMLEYVPYFWLTRYQQKLRNKQVTCISIFNWSGDHIIPSYSLQILKMYRIVKVGTTKPIFANYCSYCLLSMVQVSTFVLELYWIRHLISLFETFKLHRFNWKLFQVPAI